MSVAKRRRTDRLIGARRRTLMSAVEPQAGRLRRTTARQGGLHAMLRLTVSVLVVAAFVTGCGGIERAQSLDGDSERLMAAYADLPLTFVENRGQTDARVDFLAQGAAARRLPHARGDRAHAAAASRRGRRARAALRRRRPGAEPSGASARPAPSTTCAATTRRAGGPALPALPRESSTATSGRGSTWRCAGGRGQLKYEFRVRPGRAARRTSGSPTAARRACGATAPARCRSTPPSGALRDAPPVAYQEIGGVRVPVASRYVLERRRAAYGFAVGALRPRPRAGHRPEPRLLDASSAARATRSARRSRSTRRATPTSPASRSRRTSRRRRAPSTAPARRATTSTSSSPSSTRPAPRSSTRRSSAARNFEWGRASRSTRRATRTSTGQTKSSNFPTTGGAFDRTFNVDNCPRCGIDQYDAFVAKLNPAGSALVYSTFLGGTQLDDSARHRARRRPQRLRRPARPARRTSRRPRAPSTGRPNGGSDAFVDQAQRRRLGARLLDAARRRGQRAARGHRGRRGRQRVRRRLDALDRLPDDARRVRHDAQRRRVRRALRPVRHQAQRRRLGARLLDVPRRLEERLRRRLRARRGRQRLPGRRHAVAGLPDDAGRVRPGVRRRARGSSPSSTRPARRSSTRPSSARRGASAVAPDADGNAWLAGAQRPGRRRRRRRVRPDLQRRRGRRLRREAERDRLGAARSRRFLGGSESEGAQRRRARRGRQRLRHRAHLLGRLPDDAGRVRPHLGRRPDDLLGRRVRGQGRRRRRPPPPPTSAAAAAGRAGARQPGRRRRRPRSR